LFGEQYTEETMPTEFSAFEEYNKEVFEMVLGEASKVSNDILAPINSIGDREGCHFENGEVKTPKGSQEAFKKFVEGGWIGMVHDPELGGQGMPNLLKFAAWEQFAGANVAFFLTSILTEGSAHLIDKFGEEKLRNTYCEKMYTGEWTGTMGLTEPSAGSDVGNLKTSAKKNGDHYLITGSKIFITSAEHDLTPNIIHLVLARVEGAPAGTKGISLFVVPKYLVNEDGTLGERNDVYCGNIEHKMGIKASPTCTLNFGDEGKCIGYIVGEENTGMRLMFQMMNEARLGVGIQGLGLAGAAQLSALGYAQERAQGAPLDKGKDPTAKRANIIEHPDVRRMLLQMKSVIDGLRSLLFSVAKYIDLSEHAASDEERVRYQHFVELLTPICKSYGSDMGFRVNEMAIQVYGGYGYCQEYPVEQYCRDQKISSIYEGTNGIQAIDLLGRKIVGNRGEYFNDYMKMVNQLVEENKSMQTLAAEFGKFSKASQRLAEVTKELGEMFAKDLAGTFLQASPYLEMFGHVVVAYYLLEGAVKADESLSKIYQEAGVSQDAEKKELLTDNAEAAFYHGRIASARFFVNSMLPQVYAIAENVLSGDRSALEIVYPL
jgi:alkylation response protein AidB-like acyl-CoA dehydrogenase